MKFFSKKHIVFVIFAVFVFLSALGSFVKDRFFTEYVAPSEQNTQAVITLFAREKCSHCQDEKAFLQEWKTENPALEYQILDIEKDPEAIDMFTELTEHFSLSKSTPLTIISDRVYVGFDSAQSIGQKFKQYYDDQQPSPHTFQEVWEEKDVLHVARAQGSVCDENSEECAVSPFTVAVPFLGEVNISSLTNLTTISFLLGFVDGFNPCAMWVLVIFLIALIQIGDRMKMFVTAGIFLLAEAIMYTMILTVWFSTWNFVGLDYWVTPIVGFVAIASGLFFLHEGFFSDGTCKVASHERKKKISERINDIAHSSLTIPTILGILLLAFSVNIIEFACSIGIPQTFTQILHISLVPLAAKIWYIATYILAYMIDDLIVFGIALYSIEKIGITHKYARASNLLGGFLMLILGLILIFLPEVLAFS